MSCETTVILNGSPAPASLLLARLSRFSPPHLLSWKGAQPDKEPSFYHVWLIEDKGGDHCSFIYEEVGVGPWAKQLAANGDGLLHS